MLSKDDLFSYYQKYVGLNFQTTVANFCRTEGIDYEQFRHYKYRVEHSKNNSNNPPFTFAPVVVNNTDNHTLKNTHPTNKPLPLCSSGESITIKYPNGVVLEISTDSISSISTLINIPIL